MIVKMIMEENTKFSKEYECRRRFSAKVSEYLKKFVEESSKKTTEYY